MTSPFRFFYPRFDHPAGQYKSHLFQTATKELKGTFLFLVGLGLDVRVGVVVRVASMSTLQLQLGQQYEECFHRLEERHTCKKICKSASAHASSRRVSACEGQIDHMSTRQQNENVYGSYSHLILVLPHHSLSGGHFPLCHCQLFLRRETKG